MFYLQTNTKENLIMTKPIVCRVAPSNTGPGHCGMARQSLHNYIFARQHKGTFIVRIENTDFSRSTQEFADNILEGLNWLGIKSDVEIIYQSERGHIYKEYVDKLLKEKKAYKCYCTAEELTAKRDEMLRNKQKPLYDRTCYEKPEQEGKPFVIRFKTQDQGRVEWKDHVLGKISVKNSEISDFVIQRQDGSVGYLLANMVDDALQGVTHIVRGVDGVGNVPAQTMLYQALGFPVPEYAHTPFILNDKGEKLSKRNGDASVLDYRDKGFLPEAVVNGLARVGWSYKNEEIFSMDDLIQKFSLNSVGRAPGCLDPNKMLHINAHWIKNGDPKRIAEQAKPFMHYKTDKGPDIIEVVKLLQPRAKTLIEIAEMAEVYYKKPKAVRADHSVGSIVEILEKKKTYSIEDIEEAISHGCKKHNVTLKELGPQIRMALTGKTASPPVVNVMHVLGKKEAVARMKAALK